MSTRVLPVQGRHVPTTLPLALWAGEGVGATVGTVVDVAAGDSVDVGGITLGGTDVAVDVGAAVGADVEVGLGCGVEVGGTGP